MIKLIDYKRQSKFYKHKILDNIKKNIENGDFILGKNVGLLENKLRKITKSSYCISCSSGTDALIMSLLALNVKPGDIVFTTVYSYISTGEVIKLLGAIPVFVDIDKDTFNINSIKLEETIKNIKKKVFLKSYPENLKKLKKINLKAIIPVSLFGNLYDYKKINKIAKKYKIKVIEDAAQSFGAKDESHYSGNVSNIGCFSFYPSKSLGCYGDGGAITTNDVSIYKKLLSIRVHGQSENGVFDRLGITGRLDTIQASVLIEKLKRFNKEINLRNKIAKIYNNSFSNIDEIKLQKIKNHSKSAFTVYAIKFKNSNMRNFILNELKNNKIGFGIYYKKPFHKQKVFEDYNIKSSSFPEAEKLSKTILAIPIDPYLNMEEINKITYTIKNGIKKFYT